MNDFFFARSQMGMSLAFHIIFAAVGIGMPLLMTIAEALYLRTKNPVLLDLSQRWARGTAILFAIGAVSGTVLSFELGLLWPKFMEHAGAIIGMPFSLEGFAFFTEAIFLGVYLYGWKRVPPLLHWLAGVVVAISGILSGIFVVMANVWMNAPTGFDWKNGAASNIDPVAAMLNPASFHEALHMTLAALVATAFMTAGIHAYFLLRDPKNKFHRYACGIPLALACIAMPLQFVSGDISARAVARLQPAKLAAMEALYRTEANAPLVIGGLPNDQTMAVDYAIKIPGGLALLVNHGGAEKIPGLDAIPRHQWPNVRLVHWSFDIMVGCGCAMLFVVVWAAWCWWREKKLPDSKWFLRTLLFCSPLGFIAIETGWMVTELGRQPWIIYGFMRTSEAVTPMPGLIIPFSVFTGVYIFLGVILVFLLRRQFLRTGTPEQKQKTEPDHA